MIAKRITYVDYDNIPRTETHYFNLTKSELTIMAHSTKGAFSARLKQLVDANDMPNIMDVFLDILKNSYGVKSDDGRRLIKNDDVWNDFRWSPAFDKLFMELTQDEQAMIAFVKGILPPDFADVVPSAEAIHESLPAAN